MLPQKWMNSPDCFAKMEIPTDKVLFNNFFDDFFSKENGVSLKKKLAEKT